MLTIKTVKKHKHCNLKHIVHITLQKIAINSFQIKFVLFNKKF